MKLKCLLSIIFLILLSGIAGANVYTVSPTGSNNDQDVINQALLSAYNDGGGTVFLSSGIYEITGAIKIGSNTRLTGSQDSIIRVSSTSSQWFVDSVGIIGLISSNFHDIEIDGFQIDGNLKAFPSSYANSGSGDHNAERLIDLRASEGARANNIKIHDLKLYDSFSDALHIAFANSVYVNNVFCSDCQHSSIYYVDCLGGEINNNEVAGISSDCIRLDNCQYVKVHDNLLYSFTGDSAGKYQGGENGLQAQNQMYSHGGGSPKPDQTANLEIYNNTFAGKMLRAVWIDEGQAEENNIFIHANRYVGIEGINTSGISFDNPPIVEQSERVFQSIFDILKQTFSFSFLDKEIPINASVDITYYNNSYNPHSLVYVDGEGLSCVKYGYAGLTTTHYLQNDVWTGDLPNTENSIFIPGNLDKNKLSVTVFKSQGFHKITDFNITEIGDDSEKTVFNPELWVFVGTLTLLGLYIFRNRRRVITF